MKLNTLSAIGLTTLFLVSCGSNTSSETALAETEAPKVETVISTIEVQDSLAGENIAKLTITGMTCEMACVSAVKKELGNLSSVEVVEVDFDAERPEDVATIKYNADSVSQEEIISSITSIGGGKLYQVPSAQFENHTAPKTDSDTLDQTSSEDEGNMTQTSSSTKLGLDIILDALNLFK